MKKWILPTLVAMTVGGLTAPCLAHSEEDSLALEEAASESIKDHPEWIIALKNQHHLSEEHIQWMQEKGLSYPQMVIVSTLSEKSGKTVDDILDMRNGNKDKPDWQKIAKALSLEPNEIGQFIASARQEVQDEALTPREKNREAKSDENSNKKGSLRERG